MAKITSDRAEKAVGNKFAMVLLAAERARELNAGAPPHVKSKYGGTITALLEFENGFVDPKLYYKVGKRGLTRLRSIK